MRCLGEASQMMDNDFHFCFDISCGRGLSLRALALRVGTHQRNSCSQQPVDIPVLSCSITRTVLVRYLYVKSVAVLAAAYEITLQAGKGVHSKLGYYEAHLAEEQR